MLTGQKVAKTRANENITVTASDGGGLYLLARPSGRKTWLFRVKAVGKRQRFYIGEYPVVSLVAARLKRDEIRARLLMGLEPFERGESMTFGAVAAENRTSTLSTEGTNTPRMFVPSVFEKAREVRKYARKVIYAILYMT